MKLLGLLAACSLLLSACTAADSGPAEPATPTPLPTPIVPAKPTYLVQRGDVAQLLEFDARVVPVVSQELGFKIKGTVARLLVQEGDLVKKGQLLAELQTSVDPLALRRAQINLEKARLNLQLAQLQAPGDAKEAALVAGLKQADVDLAQLDLDQFNQALEAARLVAGMDGVVAQLSLAEGAEVEALKPVVILVDRARLEASAELDSTNLQLVKEGLPVTLRPAGDSALTVPGFIRRLPYPYGTSPAPDPGVALDRTARITLQGDWTGLEGFSLASPLKVSAVLQTHTGVLWLPPQALRKFQGNVFVVVQEGQNQRRVDVKTGLATADRVEILEGPDEGQVVVAP